jgi:putative endonuclease
MPYIYILECSDGTYYTGWTTDLTERLKAHNAGKGARYTKGRSPVKLVYWEWQENKSASLKRELEIKKLSRNQKERLIGLICKKIVEGEQTCSVACLLRNFRD